MSAKTAVSVLPALLLISACQDPAPLGPTLSPDAISPSLTAVEGVTEVVKGIGPGSTLALFVPHGWAEGERELVVYAHGYVQPFLEPALPREFDGLRDWLLMQGIGVAYSSYSETGYAVKDGAQRTHQLRGQFASEFGTPGTTYLVGISMGALIASVLEERFAPQYDGALLLCGALAGGLSNAEYIAHVRILWDALFPGTLEGSLYESPEGYLVLPPDPATGYTGSDAYWSIVTAVRADPGRAAMLAGIDPVNMPIDTGDLTELISSFVLVLGYQINGANALSERLHGHSFLDNSDTWYSGSTDDVALNRSVARYTADPAAVRYLRQWYTPTGEIDDPVVTLHTTRDPLVPYRNEAQFARRVAEAGREQRLTRLPAQEAFGHCTFDPSAVVSAFLGLREAVSN